MTAGAVSLWNDSVHSMQGRTISRVQRREKTMRDRDRQRAEAAEHEPDFANEHSRPTFAGEQASHPGMEPDESVPRGSGGDGGMDIDEATRRHESGVLAVARRSLRAALRRWRQGSSSRP